MASPGRMSPRTIHLSVYGRSSGRSYELNCIMKKGPTKGSVLSGWIVMRKPRRVAMFEQQSVNGSSGTGDATKIGTAYAAKCCTLRV